MFVVVDAVDRPHGLVSVAEVEDSLDLLHKIDFEFLASEPLARRLEAIAVNWHGCSFLLVCKAMPERGGKAASGHKRFIAAGSDFSGGKV